MATTTNPTTKRGPGRPRKQAAPRVTGPQRPQPIEPDPLTTPAGDKRAQSTADQIAAAAAAAATPGASASGGRPTGRESAMNQLADNLATAYKAIGGAVSIMALPLTLSTSTAAIGARLGELGAEIESNAIACGNALARWADTNPKVKAFLTGASGHAGMLLVIAAHLPILGAAVGRREAGQIAAFTAADGPAPAPGMADAMGFASMFADLFTSAGAGATPDQKPRIVDTTATEVAIVAGGRCRLA